jgi:hypothetical protein
VLSLQSNLKLYKEDNFLLGRNVFSSQLQHAETWDLEDLIIEVLPSNGHLGGGSLYALSWLPGVMSHILLYGFVTAIFSASTIPAFRS